MLRPTAHGSSTCRSARRSATARASSAGSDSARWLHDGLAASSARWNLIAPFVSRTDDGATRVWRDIWDGYPAARGRLLGHIAAAGVRNVVTFGGDVHAFHVTDLKTDFSDERSPTVATEFVTSSLTTDDGDYAALQRDVSLNSLVRLADCRYRCWIEATLTPQCVNLALRALRDARDPAAAAFTLARFAVENGQLGAQSSG